MIQQFISVLGNPGATFTMKSTSIYSIEKINFLCTFLEQLFIKTYKFKKSSVLNLRSKGKQHVGGSEGNLQATSLEARKHVPAKERCSSRFYSSCKYGNTINVKSYCFHP